MTIYNDPFPGRPVILSARGCESNTVCVCVRGSVCVCSAYLGRSRDANSGTIVSFSVTPPHPLPSPSFLAGFFFHLDYISLRYILTLQNR